MFVLIISFTNLFSLFDVIFNICMTAEIAQLGERQTEDLKVPGSNTEKSLRHEFWIIPGLGNFFPEFYSYKTSCLFSQFYSFLASVETRFASVSKTVSFNCLCSLFLLRISSVYLTLFFCMTAEIAQLGERQSEDLKVPGSNTENSLRHEFWIIPGLGNFFPEFCSYKTSCLFSQFYSFLAAVETRFASVSKKVSFNCLC